MSDRVKNKSSLKLSINRSDVGNVEYGDERTVPITPTNLTSEKNNKQLPRQFSTNMDSKMKRISLGGIKDLVQCTLCMEVLNNPKMLPCQHTFCFTCILVHTGDSSSLQCPVCRNRFNVTDPNFLVTLPSNLYIDSLLELVGKQNGTSELQATTQPTTPLGGYTSVGLFASSFKCSHCQAVCDNSATMCCQHCKLKFCKICWSQHLDDMQTQIGSILKQLDSAHSKLQHKIENYKDRCERLFELINITAAEKINDILETKMKLFREASELQKSGEGSALVFKTSLEEARVVADYIMSTKKDTKDVDKVTTFMNLHQNALQLITEVSTWNTEHFVFDKENFRIELDATTPLEAESDDPMPISPRNNNPLEDEESLAMHYRSKNFVPHYVWRKASRPGGVGLSPWSNNLYICCMDTRNVLIVERTHGNIVSRLFCEEMLCPIQIAFMNNTGEIFVTDKWKHCVHVFSKDGEYLRSIGQKGSRVGMFRSPEGIATDNETNHIYVVDTGNDRVQVLNEEGKFIEQFGITTTPRTVDGNSVWHTIDTVCTEFNAPTSVAVSNDRVIILDSGNRRVKVYNKFNKNKILEFGSLGQRKGQFRQPEVLTVDPLGFILVGDSGNSRVQVFKPTGQLVRVFGGYGTDAGKFGWISGVHVTKQLDIIISDTINHCVNLI